MVEVILEPLSKKLKIFLPEQVENLNPDFQGWHTSLRSHVWRPATDVYEIEGAIVARIIRSTWMSSR